MNQCEVCDLWYESNKSSTIDRWFKSLHAVNEKSCDTFQAKLCYYIYMEEIFKLNGICGDNKYPNLSEKSIINHIKNCNSSLRRGYNQQLTKTQDLSMGILNSLEQLNGNTTLPPDELMFKQKNLTDRLSSFVSVQTKLRSMLNASNK